MQQPTTEFAEPMPLEQRRAVHDGLIMALWASRLDTYEIYMKLRAGGSAMSQGDVANRLAYLRDVQHAAAQ